MENAVEALKYAFAVLIFVIALSVSMNLLSQAKATSDSMIEATNPESLESYITANPESSYADIKLSERELTANGRIVGVETIIPTLYRDYKENYVIEFYTKDNGLVMRLDLSEENRRREIWTANPNVDVKKRLDILVSGHKISNTCDGIINNNEYERIKDKALNTIDHPIERYKLNVTGLEKFNAQNSDEMTKNDYEGSQDDANKDSVKNACKYIIEKGLYSYCEGKQFVEEYAYLLSKKAYENERLVERIDKIIIRYIEIEL